VLAILAHQGGWDEMLMVAAPCALFVWLLRLARRRSLAARDEQTAATAADPPTDASHP
jgi:hypothetical protein